MKRRIFLSSVSLTLYRARGERMREIGRS